MNNKNILISGAGIAGLTLAYWLRRHGFNPVIVEHAPTLRTGGYMIDFWGVGFNVAEKMNIIVELGKLHYRIAELEFVNKNGKRVGGMNIEQLRRTIHCRHFNMLRGNLAKVIYGKVKNHTEIIFGNTITGISQDGNEVLVTLADGSKRTFDLVVGADGLHSVVRNIIFGNEEDFEYHLGYYAASFTIDNFLENQHVFQSYTTKGKSASIYSVGDNTLAAFFVYKSSKIIYPHHDIEAQQEMLKDTFRDAGWHCPRLLKRMSAAPDFYFDDVSQIRMNSWSKGRVALLGDACQCVSLIAGKGAALAMAGAYVLAGELKVAKGDYVAAFSEYQEKMKPDVVRMQKVGRNFAPSFVPETTFGIWKRNILANLMFLPIIAEWFINHFLSEKMILEEY